MPWASKPSTIPARTSPEPAVASVGRRILVDRGATVGRGDHRVGALQQDHRAALLGGAPRAVELAARGIEQPGELAFMRGQHTRSVDRGEQRRRIVGENG